MCLLLCAAASSAPSACRVPGSGYAGLGGEIALVGGVSGLMSMACWQTCTNSAQNVSALSIASIFSFSNRPKQSSMSFGQGYAF